MSELRPPYGKQFLPVPRSGVQVVIGASGWDFQKRHHCPIMVLPDGADPNDFIWPSDGNPALIYECGTYDDGRLTAMARALLMAGNPSVVAHRSAMMAGHPKLQANIENWEPADVKDFDLEDIEKRLQDFYPAAFGDPIATFSPEVKYVAG